MLVLFIGVAGLWDLATGSVEFVYSGYQKRGLWLFERNHGLFFYLEPGMGTNLCFRQDERDLQDYYYHEAHEVHEEK